MPECYALLTPSRSLKMSEVSLSPYVPPPAVVLAETNGFAEPMMYEYARDASLALGKDLWRITSAFLYSFTLNKQSVHVYVPSGYLTDGATVPRLLWDAIPPWGAYGQAAAVHDMLCEYLTVFDDDHKPVSITRKTADNILRQAMVALGVKRGMRWSVYAGVKLYTFFIELFKGPTPPQAYAAKRAFEDGWKPPVVDPAAQTTEIT